MSTERPPAFPGRVAGGPGAHLFREKAKVADPRGTARKILGYLAERKAPFAAAFVLSLAAVATGIVGTRMNGLALDRFVATGDLRGLGALCAVMIAMYAAGALATWGQSVLAAKAAQTTSAAIRRDLFRATQRLPMRHFDTSPPGDLMSRLTNDVDNVNLMLSQGVVQFFSGIVTMAGMLAAMLLLSPVLTAVGLAVTPILFVGSAFIARKARPHFSAQQKELGALNAFIEETVSGRKTVSLYSRERQAEADFAALNARYVKSSIKAQGISGVIGPFNNLSNNAVFLAIAVAGGALVVNGTGVTVGTVFAFVLYMRHFARPVNEIMSLAGTIQAALAGAERVFETMGADKERDRPGARDADGLSGEIVFEDVDFSYVPGRPVLRGATLRAEPGKTVAIVGHTGAGKTTIVNLVAKFYDYDAGRILVDGTDVRDLSSKSLRKAISLVPQEPFLFSETVRENIRCGRLDATDAEVEDAARKARAHEFVMQLPDGYDTVLSDSGGKLSQGQRQLLGIARAIVGRASVLVLDEATSSVDTRTELLIQEALLHLMKGKTCFVIAHRLSTIRNADSIVVIDSGRVVETGTHDELVAADGFYARLYNSQFRGGVEL